jgi:hypothetical protein
MEKKIAKNNKLASPKSLSALSNTKIPGNKAAKAKPVLR